MTREGSPRKDGHLIQGEDKSTTPRVEVLGERGMEARAEGRAGLKAMRWEVSREPEGWREGLQGQYEPGELG